MFKLCLDGPASVQDGNRVFADNESGTFETIIEKLEMVERIAPDYLEKISFSSFSNVAFVVITNVLRFPKKI